MRKLENFCFSSTFCCSTFKKKMETNDEELLEKDNDLTLDFSKQSLKKVERAKKEHQAATTLVLDCNEIQKLDNVETYQNLRKLSLVSNQLIRMYPLSTLIHLVELDLSRNSLVAIEGLKEMSSLKVLKLASNKIKSIEHLNYNFSLEVIDLSENKIMRISDISHLINLKELYLHDNKIFSLSHSGKKLPYNLKILSLNNNNLSDLNEVSHLTCLSSLTELSLANNPCLNFSDNLKFNYRPFVKNWCSNLIILDGHPLDDLECLKAEWLYSQGRGRSFKIGEHAALVEYLVSVCPKEKEENAETEDVKKLKLILSKAQLHQQQLRQQLTAGETFKAAAKKKPVGVPERMVLSFQDSPVKDKTSSSDLMTQSLDSGIIKKTLNVCKTELSQTPLQSSTSFVPIPDTLISPDVGHPVLMNAAKTPPFSSSRSSSRNSSLSTPENKRRIYNTRSLYENSSPLGSKVGEKLNHNNVSVGSDMNEGRNLISRGSVPSKKKVNKPKPSNKNCKETSEEENSEASKLKTFSSAGSCRKSLIKNFKSTEVFEDKNKNIEKTQVEGIAVNDNTWKAAVCIQRRWRGYRARNLNREVLSGYKTIQIERIQDYLMKALSDMETTKLALEGNRKLVVLQMQAINALWKKTTGLSVGSQSCESKTTIQDLVETCSILNKQVEALQVMVKNLQSSSRPGFLVPTATQTEIIAVHTPHDETRVIFPYNQNLKYITFDGISVDSVEDEERDILGNCMDSVNNSTATTQEIFNQDENNKDVSKCSSKTNYCDVEPSQPPTNLVKPTVKLNEEQNEVICSPNESKEPQANSPIKNSCES